MCEINQFNFFTMNDDVIDDIEKMSLIVDMSCINWMMRWISCMSKKIFKYL
jgi:hypothetical protein